MTSKFGMRPNMTKQAGGLAALFFRIVSQLRGIHCRPTPFSFARLVVFFFLLLGFGGGSGIVLTHASTTGYESPFGISGVRYPLGMHNESQAKTISSLVKSTGGSWTRGSTVIWGVIEKEKGFYDWSSFDAVIQRCQADDIYPLINIAPFARWDQGEKRGKPNDMKAFLAFLEKLVERYDFDGIEDMPGLHRGQHYLEILNEPMAVGHFFDGSVEDYFDILKQSYPVIKKASPECKLLLAGLADVEDNNIKGLPPIFSANPLTREYVKTYHTYYDLLHQMGVEQYYDIMNIHVYGTNVDDVVKYYQQFGKPIWITETSEPPKNGETRQAQGLIKRFVQALALGVEKTFWFSLTDDKDMLKSGLYDGSMRPRETFFAYRLLVDKIGESDWGKVETITTNNPNAHCYLFPQKNGPGKVWVAWADGSSPVEIHLNLPAQTRLFTVTGFQAPRPVETDKRLSVSFAGTSVKADLGLLKISLDAKPLFIEEGNLPPHVVAVDLSQIADTPSFDSLNQGRPDLKQPQMGRNNSSGSGKRQKIRDDAPSPNRGGLFFGIITEIDGEKISFRSFKGQSIVVFVDADTRFTKERYYPFDLKQLSKGDEVVLILRESVASLDRQFAAVIDKLPPKN